MIISCPSCKGRYKVDPAQFGPKGRRVRCSACGHLWTEKPPQDLPRPVEPERLPAGDAASDAASPAGIGEARGKKVGSAWGWVALVAIVAAVIIGGALARDRIIRAWPPAQRLYMALGFPVAGAKSGLRIQVFSQDHVVENGRTILVIKGKVTNDSSKVRDVPKLHAHIRGADAGELANWVFAVDRIRLLPGESAGFETRFPNPPAGAAAVSIEFSKGGT